MRKFTFIHGIAVAALLMGAGCGPQGPEPPIYVTDERVIREGDPLPEVTVEHPGVVVTASFGAPATINLEESAAFPDGLRVRLISVSDSRCPADVQCAWAGELAPIVQLSGGEETALVRLQLGTVRALDRSSDNYAVALNEATTTSVVVTVTPNPPTPVVPAPVTAP